MKARGGLKGGGSKPRRGGPPPRDQHESAFAAILADLVRRVPGARAAALVDRDGETVDYAGRGNPFEMRVAAAHFRIVLDETLGQPSLAAVRSVLVRAARASFAVHALPDGYALVVLLARGAGFRGLGRAVPACTRSLADEAGWRAVRSAWHAIDVLSDERGSPRAVRTAAPAAYGNAKSANGLEPPAPESAVEILGRYRAALPQHDRAWRVRIVATGTELTLVRESSGFWYTDEPLGLAATTSFRPRLRLAKKNL